MVIDYFKKALEIAPDYASVYFNLGVVYAELSQFDKARESFKTAKRLFSEQENLKAAQEVDSYIDRLP